MCSARLIPLNTGFGPEQLAEVIAREGVDLLVHDEDFADTVTGIPFRMGRFLAWCTESGPAP